MTENTTHRELTEGEKAFLLDPEAVTILLKDALEISDETAHYVHEFTHIGDSKEHDPLRVEIGMQTIDSARANVDRIFEVLEHPEVPQEIKDVRRKLLVAMAIAGQVALDLRRAEKDWDTIKLLHGAPQGTSAAAVALLKAILDSAPQPSEDDKS